MDAMNNRKARVLAVVKNNLMNILMISGVIIGLIVGLVMHAAREEPYTSRQIMYVSFLGEIFLQMLKCIALPLMTACLVASIGSLDTVLSKRIGSQLVVLIALTKLEAVLLGIILGLIIRPGKIGEASYSTSESYSDIIPASKQITTADTFLDIVRNMFPQNILGMFLYSYETQLIKPENVSDNMYEWDIKEGGVWKDTVNMLGIVFCSIILGLTIAVMKSEGKPLLDFFVCVTHAVMNITMWVLWISPVLIIFLIAGQLLKVKGFVALLSKLGVYLLVITLGYLMQSLLVYPLLYFLLVWKNPFRLMRHYIGALVTAFATSSSLAAMPVSITCLENANIDKRLVRFVIPVAHNISMDGAAIFEGLASVFFAQLYNRSLTFANIMTILLLGSSASVAAAGVPYSATILLIMVLEGIGLPYDDIGLILAMDWLIDRFSTVVNVLGDCIIVGLLADFNKKLLETTDPDAEEVSIVTETE